MLLLAIRYVFASGYLVVLRVILLFLPPVAVHAAVFQVTPIAVRPRLLLSAPKPALPLRRVFVYVWLAPVVLPIVRILTLVPHVAPHFVIERAPDRLKVEHVEVCVLLHPMQQIDRQLVFAVCECAQVPEVTAFLRAFSAKLRLILLRVIEGFNSVVGLRAVRPVRALICLCELAHLRRVGAKQPSLVFLMVEETLFLIVTSITCARFRLENSKVEQGYTPILARARRPGRCRAS